MAELSKLDYKFYQSIEATRRPNVTLTTLDQLASVYGIPGHRLISPRLPQTKIGKKT